MQSYIEMFLEMVSIELLYLYYKQRVDGVAPAEVMSGVNVTCKGRPTCKGRLVEVT